jgi:hypothetical protein
MILVPLVDLKSLREIAACAQGLQIGATKAGGICIRMQQLL